MNTRLFAGTRKGLFTFKFEEIGWKIARTDFLGLQIPAVLHDPRDQRLYAAVSHGHFGTKVHRSDNCGKSWHEIATPAFPPKPEGTPDVLCPMRKVPVPWSVEMIWTLEAGGADSPGELWCGTIPGGLFRSTDYGQTWELVRSLWDRPERAMWFGGGYDFPGIHSIAVDPRDPSHVTIAVSCGGVWVTRDRGLTWRCKARGMRADYMPADQSYQGEVQDPHRLVQCPGAPDHFWVQHHNGIFYSKNGGESWEPVSDVEPSHFGFAAAVHPTDPNTAWFVPAIKDEMRIPADGRLVVTRTRDGGETFQIGSLGLPQEHAYDLIYRHGMDVDPTGTRLAIGSTTGSLWISEDQGDAWVSLSHHLPPIYCVRFEA